jgi:hypothetical protein
MMTRMCSFCGGSGKVPVGGSEEVRGVQTSSGEAVGSIGPLAKVIQRSNSHLPEKSNYKDNAVAEGALFQRCLHCGGAGIIDTTGIA